MATTPATPVVHQVNLPFSYHYHHRRSKGTSLPHQLETKSHTICERLIVHSPNWKKHKLCLLPFHHPHLHVATERNDVAYSLLLATDDNGTPATWTLGLVFQQAIDRRDRTLLQSRRTLQLYWNHWRHSLHRTLSLLPDKDSSHDGDCWKVLVTNPVL